MKSRKHQNNAWHQNVTKILKSPYFCSVKMVPQQEVVQSLTLELVQKLTLERPKGGIWVDVR